MECRTMRHFIWVFTVTQSTYLRASRIERVNACLVVDLILVGKDIISQKQQQQRQQQQNSTCDETLKTSQKKRVYHTLKGGRNTLKLPYLSCDVSCAFPKRCTCVVFQLHVRMKRESTSFEAHEYSLQYNTVQNLFI